MMTIDTNQNLSKKTEYLSADNVLVFELFIDPMTNHTFLSKAFYNLWLICNILQVLVNPAKASSPNSRR